MKSMVKYLLVLFLACSAMVFAGGGLECPTCGEPPNGVGIDGNAQGAKLDGVIFMEFYNLVFNPSNGTLSANGRFVLRLRKGSDFAVFYDEAFVSDIGDPKVVESVIRIDMAPAVLARFFGGAALTVKLKNLDEFGRITTATTVPSQQSVFIISDIQLAAQ